jgi:cysteinyl-tRNA synthetase
MYIRDTLSGQLKEFTTKDNKVKLYVCGITPYSTTHVGHARSTITFDVLRRYLEFAGFEVQHVQNFTDIDDKIIIKAKEESISYKELSTRYIQEYIRDMKRLNVLPAHKYPLATEAIPRIIEIIKQLVAKDYAYANSGDVYFSVGKYNNYGQLSNRSLEDMIAGSRVEISEQKRHPMDFALWKAAKPGEPSWESPWGNGRPGWHIECTTICLDNLGETIDIHGGGLDLVFPHHENELAQSESFTDKKPFVRFWVHNGLLNLQDEKMSKSIGNLVSIGKALDKYKPDLIRLFFLSAHYRSPLNYSDQGLINLDKGLDRLLAVLRINPYTDFGQLDSSPFESKFIESMNDDLNTPQAVAILFELAHEINRAHLNNISVGEAQKMLKQIGEILGFKFNQPTGNVAGLEDKVFDLYQQMSKMIEPVNDQGLSNLIASVDSNNLDSIMDALVAIRRKLRDANSYDLADLIRDTLAKLSLIIEDNPDGSRWRWK